MGSKQQMGGVTKCNRKQVMLTDRADRLENGNHHWEIEKESYTITKLNCQVGLKTYFKSHCKIYTKPSKACIILHWVNLLIWILKSPRKFYL